MLLFVITYPHVHPGLGIRPTELSGVSLLHRDTYTMARECWLRGITKSLRPWSVISQHS